MYVNHARTVATSVQVFAKKNPFDSLPGYLGGVLERGRELVDTPL